MNLSEAYIFPVSGRLVGDEKNRYIIDEISEVMSFGRRG